MISAFAGGLATHVLGLSAQSKASFEVRKIAILAVRDEMAAARALISSMEKAGGLWPAPLSLTAGSAWETYGPQLPGFLSSKELAEVKRARAAMESVDRSVDGLLEEAKGKQRDVPDTLARRIEGLGGQLDDALAILDGAREDAAAETQRTRRISYASVAAIGLIALIGALLPTARGIVNEPTLTDSSLATRLQAESPHSKLAICDESTLFEGSFRCAVDFPGCNGQVEASVDEPACARSEQKVYKVFTDRECFEAILMEQSKDGVPASRPPGEPPSEDVHAGCIEN